MDKIPSDVVELIIAVDLNPSNPEEPLNVNSVDVRGKGEGGEGAEGGDDWKKLTMQLLMGDPQAGVTSDSISYDEAVEATARALGESEEPKDPFSKAKAFRGSQDKPERPSFGEKPEGGMKMALDRAIGRKKDDEDEEF